MRKSSRLVISDLAQAHGFPLLLLFCMGLLLLVRNSSFMICHHVSGGFIRNANSSSSSSNPDRDSVLGIQECQKNSNGSRFTNETVFFSENEEQISATTSTTKKLITVLLGVMISSVKAERRSLLRLAYGVQNAAPFADIAVNFVVCKPESQHEKLVVGMERLQYNDMLVLDCEENMNHGKTFVYLSSVAAMGIRYDYVMKTDDDSYVRLQNLGRSLSEQPRNDLYYGYILPCENQDAHAWYMAGMGYVLSWDLVEWVHDSPIPKNNSEGTEDRLLGEWVNAGGVAKNRVSMKPLFYDHPDFGGECSHPLVPETILVHQLKTPQRWSHVLSFFEHDRIDLLKPALMIS